MILLFTTSELIPPLIRTRHLWRRWADLFGVGIRGVVAPFPFGLAKAYRDLRFHVREGGDMIVR